MEFRPLCLEDKAWIMACRDTREHPFTALSFPSLFAWREAYGLRVAGDQDFFVIRSFYDGGYYCPCGTEDKCLAFLESMEAPARILYLTEEQAKYLAGRGWTTRHRADLSEYICSAAALALQEGHISNSFKVKCRRYRRNLYYTTHVLSEADLPMLRKLAEKIKADGCRSDYHDLGVLSTEIEHMQGLGMRGIALEVPGGYHAFILGYENKPDMFTMTMSKHDPDLPTETTTVCIHELAQCLAGEYSLINIEEDLGLEGLRESKRLYSPVDRLEVFEASKT